MISIQTWSDRKKCSYWKFLQEMTSFTKKSSVKQNFKNFRGKSHRKVYEIIFCKITFGKCLEENLHKTNERILKVYEAINRTEGMKTKEKHQYKLPLSLHIASQALASALTVQQCIISPDSPISQHSLLSHPILPHSSPILPQ